MVAISNVSRNSIVEVGSSDLVWLNINLCIGLISVAPCKHKEIDIFLRMTISPKVSFVGVMSLHVW